VKSEEALLAEYNVRLGGWLEDECLEYCPVIPLTREEMDTLHDGEDPQYVALSETGLTPIESHTDIARVPKLHDIGMGVLVLNSSGLHDPSTESAAERLMTKVRSSLLQPTILDSE
jgi:hypothetical protein